MPCERVTNLEDETAAETLSPLTELPEPSNISENTPHFNKKKKSKKKKEAEKSNGKENNKENDYRGEEWFYTDCNELWDKDGEDRWIICDIHMQQQTSSSVLWNTTQSRKVLGSRLR